MNPRCSRCGAVLRTAGLFCEACGQRVVAAVGDAPPLPRQTVFAPPEASGSADRPAEAEDGELDLEFAEHAGGQQVVTVLYTDLSGYAALADSFYRALAEPVYRHGGVVDTHVSDAVLAFFGAPLAHDDDPVQALRAALEMQGVAERFAAELEAKAGERVSLRIGIDTGAARVGAAHRKPFAVRGRPVALAQEIEAAAPPGGILISEATRQVVAGAFDCAPREDLHLAGDPVPVFEVLAEAAGPDGPAGGMRMGREAEIGQLARAWSDVLGGQPAIVYVRSPAGLGKTGLLVRLFGAGDSPAVLWARCSPFEASEPCGWLKRTVRALLGAPEGDPGIDGLLALIRRSAFHLGDDPEACDLLDLLLHGRVSEDLAGVAPRHLKAMLFRTVAALLVSRAKAQPLALLADDLHWIDDASAEFLQSLFREFRKARARVLLVGAYRPGIRLVPTPAGTLPLREVVLKPIEGLPSRAPAPLHPPALAGAAPAVAAELHARAQDAPAAADAYLRAAERSFALACNHDALRQTAAARQWAERAGSARLPAFERRVLLIEAEAAVAIGDLDAALSHSSRLVALSTGADAALTHARHVDYLIRAGKLQQALDAAQPA
ncbi:MAG: AAA family ATPase, partial [Candidatus Sericytochromatia bacterium]|nr:AAA family ATPase [Candidatus Tanganyikabacteria bacterium]